MRIHAHKQREWIRPKRGLTFAVLQGEDSQIAEPPCNDVQIVVDNTGVERAGRRLGEIELENAREACCQAAQHGRTGARAQVAALGALDPEPAPAHEPERVALRLGPQAGEHRTELIVGEHLVDEGLIAFRR